MKFNSSVLATLVLLFACPAALADGIDFTSNVSLSDLATTNGDYVSFLGSGYAVVQQIPIASIGSGGQMAPVASGICGSQACGWLNFRTGSLISSSPGQDVRNGDNGFRIIGMVTGGTKNVLFLTVTFVGPVTVTEISSGRLGGTLVWSGQIEVKALNNSVLALFPGLVVPTQLTQVVLRTTVGSNGSIFTAVPEPSSMALLGVGLLLVVVLLGRR